MYGEPVSAIAMGLSSRVSNLLASLTCSALSSESLLIRFRLVRLTTWPDPLNIDMNPFLRPNLSSFNLENFGKESESQYFKEFPSLSALKPSQSAMKSIIVDEVNNYRLYK